MDRTIVVVAIEFVMVVAAIFIPVEMGVWLSWIALAFGAAGVASPKGAVAADAISALRSLGFNDEKSAKMVAEAIAKSPDADNAETIIKIALASR